VRGLAGLLAGRDPTHTAALWRSVREHTWWYGVGGIATFAHAAIDMALWDLRGQATGQRVVNLLGGPVHDRRLPSCPATPPAPSTTPSSPCSSGHAGPGLVTAPSADAPTPVASAAAHS